MQVDDINTYKHAACYLICIYMSHMYMYAEHVIMLCMYDANSMKVFANIFATVFENNDAT